MGDYFPYGKVLRQHVIDQEKYISQGNEREYVSELDYFNARFYDADLGRFNGVDMLASQFPSQSPFMSMDGNPVMLIDPSGLNAGDYYDTNKNFLGNDGIDDDKVYTVNGSSKFNIKEFQEGGKYYNNHSAFNENNGEGYFIKYDGKVEKTEITFFGTADKDNPKLAEGTLRIVQTLENKNRFTRMSVSAVGGPWGNGSPENGKYTVDNLLDRGPDGWYSCGMTVDGFGFSLNLNPTFNTGRSLLRIHPDGGSFYGTQGCIGLTCDVRNLKLFESYMQFLLSKNTNIPLVIWVINNPNNDGRGKKVKSNGE